LIKVVDIFAGPGGLSEGFEAVKGASNSSVFEVMLSIEKEAQAHKTLTLRSFYRQFSKKNVPEDYYRFLRGEIKLEDLYKAYPKEAQIAATRCWNAALGPDGEPMSNVRDRIKAAIGTDKNWVLIGGPPCQAYSLAGRSRNQGNPNYEAAKDIRQRLYVEYLQILAEHRPAVFVMENVKGLLSAKLGEDRVFHRILSDLSGPETAIKRENRYNNYVKSGGYKVYALAKDCSLENGEVDGVVIHAEKFGIPQARHRVILLGIRDDLLVKPHVLKPRKKISSNMVLSDLPHLRSGISPKTQDSAQLWKECLKSQVDRRWVNAGASKAGSEKLSEYLKKKLAEIVVPNADRGDEFIRANVTPKYASRWFHDSRIQGVCNHSSRSHMESDLFRYFYAACYARVHKKTPSLKQFPTDLLPDHVSVSRAVDDGYFSDRFRVQIASNPSTTIVSHISKDGHYYIHNDPLQCRSLTVREAARLQTFPDNYFFCGNRTSQYTQVGNAVPPLLAKQIGDIVRDVLVAARIGRK
jgi:DNA (cytosine-5)-methyltransferase 1